MISQYIKAGSADLVQGGLVVGFSVFSQRIRRMVIQSAFPGLSLTEGLVSMWQSVDESVFALPKRRGELTDFRHLRQALMQHRVLATCEHHSTELHILARMAGFSGRFGLKPHQTGLLIRFDCLDSESTTTDLKILIRLKRTRRCRAVILICPDNPVLWKL